LPDYSAPFHDVAAAALSVAAAPPLLSFTFTPPSTPEIHPLSLHDALPISDRTRRPCQHRAWHSTDRPVAAHYLRGGAAKRDRRRSEEHTSELQSPCNLVCRLLLEKKNGRGLLSVKAGVGLTLARALPLLAR